MKLSKYRWTLPETDDRLEAELAEKLGVSRLVAGVLVARGWTSADDTAAFLNAGEEQLHDPFAMKDMRKAADRIARAIASGERIRVYGDYDADGVTSTALMTRLLTLLGANFDTYIPHRGNEGYGLNLGAIDKAAEAGVTLLVTVDNGISAIDQIAYAAEKGIEVVVTDHHEPPASGIVPAAYALVNPKQEDCHYPFKGLCGAGVVFKLAHAMTGRPMLEYADLAAIGTIADLMPLVGENRVIARLGLAQLRRDPAPGIRALAKVSGAKPEELTSGKIGFGLAPRLNAGGRLAHASGALQLLVAAGEAEAEALATELDELNKERQALVETTVAEADGMWKAMVAGGEGRNVIVLAGEGWNPGIAGLVASKLVERYYRPAIVLAVDPITGKCKGSARSIDGFDLFEALSECASLMDHFGGHTAAAGLTISRENIAPLSEHLHELAGRWLTEEDWQPKKRADLVCTLAHATLAAVEQLARLEPFGNANPTPRVVMHGLTVRDVRTLGKENNHLKLTVEQDGRSLEAIAFGIGAEREKLTPGMRIDLLGELSVNEWNGSRRVQLVFQDWRTDELRLVDKRKDKDAWRALGALAAEETAGTAVLCASARHVQEAIDRIGHTGIHVSAYADGGPGQRPIERQVAATSEPRGGARADGNAWERLILFGLPDNERDAERLSAWLSPGRGVECVVALADPRQDVHVGPAATFPDRSQFGEVYGRFKRQGSWLDAPEGFLQTVATETGWPLATVRMMQDVFAELGFIQAQGSTRQVVAAPPRNELDKSERYARAKQAAEAQRLRHMSADELRSWMHRWHLA
ncbi:single-stranded-DNA-specific exonuclease RecJ [Cohnella sp. GCM10027633]|uniref:single-stranded-DNA-specific exonuclease RecJ n=1 Tax=unclassified Cohnella TaxID=2636738 RepID=UPI003625DCB3